MRFADIIGNRLTGNDILRCLYGIGGQLHAGGEIVGGTGGDIAYGNLNVFFKQTGNGFVEGAVTAAADHQIHIAAPQGSHLPGRLRAVSQGSEDRLAQDVPSKYVSHG